jgi:hypothetical protein
MVCAKDSKKYLCAVMHKETISRENQVMVDQEEGKRISLNREIDRRDFMRASGAFYVAAVAGGTRPAWAG